MTGTASARIGLRWEVPRRVGRGPHLESPSSPRPRAGRRLLERRQARAAAAWTRPLRVRVQEGRARRAPARRAAVARTSEALAGPCRSASSMSSRRGPPCARSYMVLGLELADLGQERLLGPTSVVADPESGPGIGEGRRDEGADRPALEPDQCAPAWAEAESAACAAWIDGSRDTCWPKTAMDEPGPDEARSAASARAGPGTPSDCHACAGSAPVTRDRGRGPRRGP